MPGSYLDQNGLKHYNDKVKGIYVPSSRTINGKPLSSNITLSASDVSALSSAGGSLSGNLTLKGSTNYGRKLNFGDSDYVHISEPIDDCMEIKANKINFLLSQNTDDKFTINGINPFGQPSSSGNITTFSRNGTDTQVFTIEVASPDILTNAKFMMFYTLQGFSPVGVWISSTSRMLGFLTSGTTNSNGSITIEMSGSTITATINNYSSTSTTRFFNSSSYTYDWVIMS